MDNFIKVAASVPELKVADINYNVKKIKEQIDEAKDGEVNILDLFGNYANS